MKPAMLLASLTLLVGSTVPVAADDRIVEPGTGPIARAVRRQAARLAAQISPQVAQASPTRRQNRVARHPVLVGALAGGAVAASLEKGAALGGAGVGALGGLAAHAIIGAGLTYEASGPADVQAVKRIVGTLGAGGQVDVVDVRSGRTRGRIEAIGDDAFLVAPDGQSTRVPVSYA